MTDAAKPNLLAIIKEAMAPYYNEFSTEYGKAGMDDCAGDVLNALIAAGVIR